MAIDEQYASPGLRWGLLQDDYPGASNEYRLVTADDIPGGHPFASPGEEFVLCTITFPPAFHKSPAYGWKPLSEARKRDDESYAALRTKALGRAIKDAGYPDKLPDLKALMVWRKRAAEIGALAAGNSGVLDSTHEALAALDEAAEPTPDGDETHDKIDNDEVSESPTDEQPEERTAVSAIQGVLPGDDRYVEPEQAIGPQYSVGDGSDEKRSELMEVILGLDNDSIAQLREFSSSNGMTEDLADWDGNALEHLEAWLSS